MNPAVDPAAGKNHAIGVAASYGRSEVVQLLLADARINPADNDNDAIQRASAAGMNSLVIVELLVQDPRVDPSANNNRAIQFAALSGNLDTIEFLLQHPKVDPIAAIDKALATAGLNNTYGMVSFLEKLKQQQSEAKPQIFFQEIFESSVLNCVD
jgi:ankyrin repeat protein